MVTKKKKKPISRSKKPKGSKKKRQSSSFLSTVLRLFLWALLIAALVTGILYLHDRYKPEKTTAPTLIMPGEEIVPPEDMLPDDNLSVSYLSFPDDAEIPRLLNNRKDQMVRHEGYTVSYNADYRISNWVAWELTAEKAVSDKVERKDSFTHDPYLDGCINLNIDYKSSGYDKGHLAPAADMRWSETAMTESFYFSNICPQAPALNRGVWKKLEEKSREWAEQYGIVWIVTGPVITDDMKRLGKNKVAIPQMFYKVICTVTDKNYEAIAFLFENRGHKNLPLSTFAIPVDSVEKVTGIDFFHLLPDDLETEMETRVNIDYWFAGSL